MENFNFGLAGSGLTILLNILPIVSFFNFFKKKINFDALPTSRIFTNYANCLIWFFYGTMKGSMAIRISNMVGAIISFLLIIMYLLFELKTNCLDTFLNFILIIIGTIASNKWFSHIAIQEILVGRICLCITFVSFLTQVPNIIIGIKDKNYLLIPVNYAIIGFPTHFCWIVFSLIIWDYYIFLANIVGIIYSIIQILLYSFYKKEYPIINEEEVIASTIGIDVDTKKERPVEIISRK